MKFDITKFLKLYMLLLIIKHDSWTTSLKNIWKNILGKNIIGTQIK